MSYLTLMKRPSARTIRLASVATCLLIVATFSMAARQWLISRTGTVSASTRQVAEPATTAAALQEQGGNANAPLVVERLKLRPTGFEPSSLTLTHGRVLFVVYNKSGQDEVNLRLDREAGGRLRNVRLERHQSRWRDVVDLHPGRYVLSVKDHPDWSCRIMVTAR